jgi:hypothetical protein
MSKIATPFQEKRTRLSELAWHCLVDIRGGSGIGLGLGVGVLVVRGVGLGELGGGNRDTSL